MESLSSTTRDIYKQAMIVYETSRSNESIFALLPHCFGAVGAIAINVGVT